ncbi:MAG: efflux RND transporter periplasmic adaptor subunit [Syntrophomonadaceae bacterium]|nr:efflux RND transporter periplasmic adaptor subunit [Syntrophomonadaceae bacterium]
MQAKPKFIPMVLILVVLAGGAYWAYSNYFAGAASSLQATGTIEATTVDITAKAAGTIKALSFQEGDLVKKDQLLGELTRNDLAAQGERDALAVAAAQAKLDDLISGARSQEIKQAAANLNIAQINLDQANLDLDRVQKLFQAGAGSQQELEQAQANADLKENQLDAAQAALSLIQEGTRPAQINAAAAEVERTKAVLKATETLLDDLKISSPIEGTVLNRNYEPGEYVSMGANLATIADLNRLWLTVYIPTDDLPSVQLGEKVHITVSGGSSGYTGTVAHIASKGEFTPKTIQTKQERTNVVFAVKITIDESQDSALKPGMPADVVFDRS